MLRIQIQKRMKALVRELKQRHPHRLIFFDPPPLLTNADAMAFASLVDAIIIVVEAGKTPMTDIQEALNRIPQEKFLGFVLNRHS